MIDQTVLAEVAAFAETCSFPCSKEDLLDQAEETNAPDEVYTTLEKLPDKEFLSETDIIETIQCIT